MGGGAGRRDEHVRLFLDPPVGGLNGSPELAHRLPRVTAISSDHRADGPWPSWPSVGPWRGSSSHRLHPLRNGKGAGGRLLFPMRNHQCEKPHRRFDRWGLNQSSMIGEVYEATGAESRPASVPGGEEYTT